MFFMAVGLFTYRVYLYNRLVLSWKWREIQICILIHAVWGKNKMYIFSSLSPINQKKIASACVCAEVSKNSFEREEWRIDARDSARQIKVS